MIDWPHQVVSAIARRKSVILIGSGVSANAIAPNGDNPPTWKNFLDKTYEKLGKKLLHIRKAIDTGNYLDACEFLKEEHGSNWIELIRNNFADINYKPADIHKHIFGLDSRIVMSINFDKIYDSYAIAASEGTVVVKNYYDSDIRQVVAGHDRYIIKPHGTVDATSKLIFTSEEYARSRVEHATFYELLNALLHTHTFVCIGCGLSDPDFKTLFEDYRFKLKETPHYICLPSPIPDPVRNFIRRTRGLNVITYSARDNHIELTNSLEKLIELVTSSREDIARLQNW